MNDGNFPRKEPQFSIVTATAASAGDISHTRSQLEIARLSKLKWVQRIVIIQSGKTQEIGIIAVQRGFILFRQGRDLCVGC
jgi:hypothetical protein